MRYITSVLPSAEKIKAIKRIIFAAAFFLCPSETPTYAQSPANIPAVQTIATMVALGTASKFYPAIQVLGYNNANDGGGGFFTWSTSSVATADHCVNFAATGVVTGRWVRQLNGQPLSVLMCGAYNNNTNSGATQAALQYSAVYAQASASQNQTILIPAGDYACGTGPTCIQTNGASWCPNYIGEGAGDSIIHYSPVSEGAAFLFNSGIGQCNGGGVSNVRVTGNANTIGCEFFSTNFGHCNITVDTVKMHTLWCSCSAAGFSENTVSVSLQGTTSFSLLGEYRTNSGGSGSFRDSGFGPNSLVSPSASANALILIDAGSQVYSAPLYMSINNQSNGTVYFVDNQSANLPSFYGSWQIETDGTSITKLAKSGSLGFGGSTQYATGASAQLIYGNTFYGNQIGTTAGNNSYKSTYQVLENASSAVQYLTAGTGATTTLNGPPATGVTTYNLSLYNSSTYNWNGIVTIVASGIGQYSVTAVGHRFYGTNDPTFAVTAGGALQVTVGDVIAANSTRVFGVVNLPGELN